MRQPHDDAQTTQVMASLRRLRAAAAASEINDPVDDGAVIGEIRRILDSDGMRNLLAHTTDGYFRDVICKLEDEVTAERRPSETLARLNAVLSSQELTAALATDDPDEQPDRLLSLMLEGPFKGVPRESE